MSRHHVFIRRVLPIHIVLIAIVCALTPLHASSQSAPDDPAIRAYAAANGFLHRGMNDMAVQEFRAFLTNHPKHEKVLLARYGLGVALYRTQKHEESIAELKPLLQQSAFEFAAEVMLMTGQSQFSLGRYAEAAINFQQFITSHVKHASADMAAALLVESLYRAGQLETVAPAATHLNTHWPRSPHRERAAFFTGIAAFDRKDYSAATETFITMQEQYPDGLFADRVTLLLAQSLQQQGKTEDAAKQYRRMIKKTTGDDLAQALYGLATTLPDDHASDAAAALDQLIAQFPDHQLAGAAMIERGRLWMNQKKYDRAVKLFEKAGETESLRDQAAYWMAKCHMRQDQWPEAATLLSHAITTFPSSPLQPELTFDCASACLQAGQLDLAVQMIQQFRKKHPQHALAADALYLHAAIEHQRKNSDACRTLCAAFIDEYEQHALAATVLFLAAENDLHANDFRNAAQSYRRFLTAFPKHTQANTAAYRLGLALYRTEDFDAARDALAPLAADDLLNAPEFRQGWLMLGEIHMAGERWADAAMCFSTYAAFGHDQPSADSALLKSGLAYMRLNDPQRAAASFDLLLTHHPRSEHRAQALFERAQIHLAQSEQDQAQQLLTQIMKDHAKASVAPYALNHLAILAVQEQDFANGAKSFERLAKEYPNSPLAMEAIVQQGQALMALKQHDRAADLFERFVKEHASHERAATAQAYLAVAIARQDRHADALQVMANLTNDQSARVDRALLSTVLYEQAWCLRETKRQDEATAAYRDLAERFEDQPIALHALLELAELEMAAKQHGEAAESLTRLLILAKKQNASAEAIALVNTATYRLAVCQYELGDFDAAAALADACITGTTDKRRQTDAHLLCGESNFKKERFAKALPHFAFVVEQNANDAGYQTSLLRLGECHAAAKQWTESERAFARHRKEFPESEHWFQAQFGVAWAMENQNRLDDAITAYRVVVDKHSGATAARAQFQIGECYYATKRYEDAIRELLKVDILFNTPEWSAAALYEAGRCYEELKNPTQAKAQFQLVQQKHPATRWAELAGERLAALNAHAPTSP